MNGIAALRDKLNQLQKMRRHLAYSHDKVTSWWRVDSDFDDWNEDQLESLAAFKGRFAEFQDHLASAMKLIANIEGEDARLFTYVLNYMVQLEIVADMNDWQAVRGLRNTATHDYSESEMAKAKHFDSLLKHTNYLYETEESLACFVARTYPKKNGNES
ncbi:MAG: hypothetical protein Q7U78_08340 [Gallionella sp.]|nr:hypothetical protein [Gallionella sp.]